MPDADFALLGAMLEEQGREPAAIVLAEEVFVPTGMKHVGILADHGLHLDLAPMRASWPQNFFTAGNGYASVNDLLSFFDSLGDETCSPATRGLLPRGAPPPRWQAAMG